MARSKRTKRFLKTTGIILFSIILLTATALVIAYQKKDQLIQKALADFNESIKGKISVEEVRISPFENFPYISIDLFHISLATDKTDRAEKLIKIDDAYIGFDVLSIIQGDYEVKKIKLSNGTLNIIQEYDGTLNLVNALVSTLDEIEEVELDTTTTTSVDLKLNSIELENIDIIKLSRENDLLAEIYIENAKSSFNSAEDLVEAELETEILFNLIIDNDTTFLHDKHLQFKTAISYDLEEEFLSIAESKLQIEDASFLTEGTIDIKNDQFLDLTFSGDKPNFDLFLAFAPPELNPVLSRYDNGGRVYFNASVFGPVYLGSAPHIDVEFGCEEAFVENTIVDKGLRDLFFKGRFTNGDLNDASTTELIVEEIRAKPETGVFNGAVSVKNLNSPDIEMAVDSEFDLDFLKDFFELEDLEDVSGEVALKMNFHDIIDLNDPAKAIERFNESYYTELRIKDLNFRSPDYHLPVTNLNVDAFMDGHEAKVENLSFKIGESDLTLNARISDLPAIIHHTNIPVEVDLNITSELIDFTALSTPPGDSIVFDEQLKNLSLGFNFKSSARAFTESPNLPLGEFFINELNAQLTHYPHALHDFNADVIIDSTDFKVIDFTGFIDESDFHFNGKLKNYDLWFETKPVGSTMVDFNLTASQLKLNNLFSYGGENYVPDDYRNEEFDDVKIHGVTTLEFDESLVSTKLAIDQIEAYMPEHDMRFEKFSANIELDSIKLNVDDFTGKIGNSELVADLTYYLNWEKTAQEHSISIKSPHLDFDQLFSYMPPEESVDTVSIDHEAGFNVFDLPFSNMNFEVDIEHLNYHKYLIDDFLLKGRMQKDHFIYVDTMALEAAGGAMRMSGYFNGSDPDKIYFSPNMELEHVDLDKLLFKFDNFGQDQLVSNNLHGELSGKVTGKIRMHPDLVPLIDDSQLNMQIEVINGSLVEFSAFEALSDFFTDKNLALVRFDTLKNELKLENGDLIIPNMNINTSLGYFEISGRQGFDMDMEYAMRIPVKVVAKAGWKKLFSKKGQDNSGNVDDIEYRDFTRRTRFLNVVVSGTPDDYNVSIGKAKR